jgi:hypothetical protein
MTSFKGTPFTVPESRATGHKATRQYSRAPGAEEMEPVVVCDVK